MIKEKYLKKIKQDLEKFNEGKNLQIFIFGSSLIKKNFADLDIGIMGNIKNKELNELKEKFTDSDLPYFIDIINFNQVDEKFKKNVFNNKILWITR
ncbi:nucleotidyltransferase domain-containing protein [bacterium]|nr:nucleotidyltransferase domain-containing protein [bacterium]